MRQIYHVHTTLEDKWDFDPTKGPRLVSQEAMRESGTDRIVHKGQTYEVQPDGTFHLPDDVAEHFIGRPGWHPGENPFHMKEYKESQQRKVERVAP